MSFVSRALEFVGIRGSETRAPSSQRPSASSSRGRPDYVPGFSAFGTLPREASYELFAQFYNAIPLIKRSTAILSGFAGGPEFLCPNQSATDELNEWATTVAYGYVGTGVLPWLADQRRQGLIYGYAIGESEVAVNRREVTRLWSYRSPSCDFRPKPDGSFDVVQSQPGLGLVALDPLKVTHTTYDSQGSDPRGESLYQAIPTCAQIWLDAAYAYRQTWRRSGTPKYHINWEPTVEWNDPTGKASGEVLDDLESAWNEGMRSVVVDGKVQDYFSSGKVTVTTIGADGEAMDIQIAKRNLVEEVVVATGIPPWMLGYSWSTTERLSAQQADTLIAWINVIRRADESSLRRVIDLRQRLTGRVVPYEIVWPEITLQDAREIAEAKRNEAQAALLMQRVRRQRWADGIISQREYSEEETDNGNIVVPFDAPQPLAGASAPESVTPDAPPEGESQARSSALDLRELRGEYPELWKLNGCAGRH